jgi:3D (Asp-Asp-Asp) domain-containing protein
MYSPVIMMTGTIQSAGSRMIGKSTESPLPRLARFALVLGVGLLLLGLLGAAKPRPVTKQIVSPVASVIAQPIQSSNQELMHDDPAVLASPVAMSSLGSHQKVIWMEVTAYCGCPKCCGPHARGLTASGRSVTYNGGQFVAADKRLFKFGTQFQIPGYANGQTVEVIDRGGAIKGFHLDVFFPNHDQAKAWGRKWMAVTVVE